jgi:glucokinase
MTILLAGDIGGTKTLLRLVDSDGEGLQTLDQATYPSQEFSDLVPMVEAFLTSATQKLTKKPTPEKACFAIAGPVVNHTAKLTNLPWVLETHRLEQELKLSCVSLINDFAAVGYGVLGLKAEDICPLQAVQPQTDAPIGVIGAGTGLGQGFLIPQNSDSNYYRVFASEGGHVDFAPRNALEAELRQYLLEKYQLSRVSVERIVSGQGIVAIYQFLRDCRDIEESAEIAQIVKTWEQKKAADQEITVDPAAKISAAALAKQDRLCEKTMQVFIEAYGAEAGNLALKLLPYGGLYIAGGIAAKNLPLMKQGHFMEALTTKGRVSPLLAKVPISIILNPQVGLIGAAICAAQL